MSRADALLGALNNFVFLLFAASVTLLISFFTPNNNVLLFAAIIFAMTFVTAKQMQRQ